MFHLLLGYTLFITSLIHFFSPAVPTQIPNGFTNSLVWKTYTNEKYGFETTYRSDLDPEQTVGSEVAGQFTPLLLVRFTATSPDPQLEYVVAVDEQIRIEDYLQDLIGHVTSQVDSQEEIVANGIVWTKLNYQTTNFAPTATLITNHAGYSFSITSSAAIANRLLPTFKFLK